jgi:DNA-binding Lrp family transcriptional regulator
VDFDKQAIISVLGTPLTLDECPADLRPLMRELMDIGSSALKLIEEDDELAIRALSSGQDVQEETRMERVKKILLEGVGYEYRRVGSFGGRRRSVEGRGLAFSNRIGELAVRMTALRAFRERQYGVFKVLVGIGS